MLPNMITLTRQDGRDYLINPTLIVEVDADGFGRGSWLTKNDGSKVNVKESVADVRAKLKGVAK